MYDSGRYFMINGQIYGKTKISTALIADEEYSIVNEHQLFMSMQPVNDSFSPTVKPPEVISELDTMLPEIINIQSYIQGIEQAKIDDDLSRFQR